MPRRRANHEGSFYRRKSDKRWVAVFQGRTKTHKDEARARQMWESMKREALAGYNHRAATSGLHTVETMVERLISPMLSPATQAQYRAATAYLFPYLGSRSIQQITTSEVNQWLQLLGKKHGQTNTRIRQVAYDLLNRACKLAMHEGLILRSPCLNTKRPQSRRKPMQPPTMEEVSKIMNQTISHRYHAAFALGLLAGLRPCEIFGLRWSRVDFKRRILIVDQAAVVHAGNPVTMQDHSKTKAAFREVPLIPHLVDALKRRKQQAAAEGLSACELVVPTKHGTPTTRTTFLSRTWKPMLAKLGMEVRSFYNSRHSCVTLLAGLGVPLQVIAKIVGHADSRTTQQTYCHVLGGDTLKAMDRLSETLADLELTNSESPTEPDAERTKNSSTKHLLKKSPRGDESAR